jgi:hypothetical protein
VTFCHQCGYQLNLGIEKFCPKCGTNLQAVSLDTRSSVSTDISNALGDVLGTGVSGNKNIIGKEFAYTREGHAIVGS